MNDPNLVGEFLRARRDIAQPADVGLGDDGSRRVQGLRREEVAMLAGVSIDYYNRLEQGRDRHPSPEVITALARVFDLDDDSVAHLRELARPMRRRSRRPAVKPERIRPALLAMLHTVSDKPVLVQTRFRDVLACTSLAAALHPGLIGEPNMLRLLFLDPAQRDLYSDWERVARESVAWLRAGAGVDLDHPRLTSLVGELTVHSDDFARMWNRHDVRMKSAGTRHACHPVAGRFTVSFETLAINASPGQFLTIYYVAPNSPDTDALALLAHHGASSGAGRGTVADTGVLVSTGPGRRTGTQQQGPILITHRPSRADPPPAR